MLHERRRQIRNLPLILAGGFALAAAAGYVNVVVISAGGPAVTHVTGSVSSITADIGHRTPDHALLTLGVVLSFALGAVASGAIIGEHTLRIGRPYGLAVMAEGLLLVLAGLVLPVSLGAGACLAACAAGLQNAFASSYRGMIVRTTHTTGILTDLGFLAGARLRGHRVAPWRFGMLAGLLGSFVAGGLAGAVSWDTIGHAAMPAAGAPLLIGGLGYYLWRRHANRPDDRAEPGPTDR